MNENDLRNAMHQRVSAVSPNRERLFKAQLAASQRRRRRDAVGAAIASSALSVLVVLGVFGLQGSGSGPTTEKGPTSATINLAAQVEGTDQQAPTAQSSSRPATIVGAADSGRLVLIDSKTGATTKLLTQVKDPNDNSQGGLLGHVAVSTTKQMVYFDTGSDNCNAKVESIGLNGGTPAMVVNGSTPALNPDDTQLAYVKRPACDNPTVVVRNLTTGSERTVARAGTARPTDVANLSWSPDGAKLLLDLRYTDGSANHLATVSSTGSTTYDAAQALTPPAAAHPGTVWEYGTYLPDGRAFVHERCCSTPDGTNATSSTMVIVDPVRPDNTTVIAYGFVDKTHTSFSSDESGSHLLYLSGQDLEVSDDGGRPAPIAHGLVGAAWGS